MEARLADSTPASQDALPDSARRWVAATLDAEVIGVERFARGRQAWWVETRATSGDRRWMLKGRRAPAALIARSRLLSEFGPARESAAMRALVDTDVPVPAVGGFDAASSLLLIGRVAGSALLQRREASERQAVVAHYGALLARLHQLDLHRLSVGPAIPTPTDDAEMAVGGWLGAAEADAATGAARLRSAEPLHDLLRWWLHERRPNRGLGVMRLLHGDAGVNNFLFADGRVTALIDWELSIIGDPMSDLGNARYREALYPTGTYATLIRSYEAASGVPVDRRAISYYTALAATVLSLGMVANIHRPRASQPEVVARIWQDAVARCVACEAVAESEGIDIAYDEGSPVTWSPFDSQLELLADRLGQQVLRASPGQPEAEAQGYAWLGVAAQDMVRSGGWIESRMLDDAAPLLGARPASSRQALQDLRELACRGPDPTRLAGLLRVLARDARRRLEILRPLQSAEAWEDGKPVVEAGAAGYCGPAEFILPAFPATAGKSEGP